MEFLSPGFDEVLSESAFLFPAAAPVVVLPVFPDSPVALLVLLVSPVVVDVEVVVEVELEVPVVESVPLSCLSASG